MAEVTAQGFDLQELLNADIDVDFGPNFRFAGMFVAPGARLSFIVAPGVAITMKGRKRPE